MSVLSLFCSSLSADFLSHQGTKSPCHSLQRPHMMWSLLLFPPSLAHSDLATLASFSSVSVMSVSLRSHGLQHTRPPCPSPTPGAYSNSCPLSWWCHPTISSSVVPFSSCLQSSNTPACCCLRDFALAPISFSGIFRIHSLNFLPKWCFISEVFPNQPPLFSFFFITRFGFKII